MVSPSPTKLRSVAFAAAILFLTMALGAVRYRGPTPLGADAPDDVPAAARMRATLEELLGRPSRTHSVGTPGADDFLNGLEQRIGSFGIATQRIVIPLDRERHGKHFNNTAALLEDGTPLTNLLATVPGRDPDLKTVMIATHHDSCRFGPGAGDAGVPVVALVEYLRILSLHPPRRTTQFLFTDGEEYGLLGAYALADQQELPFARPGFVLNFDARGTSGGVPMFETHPGNAPWVDALIGDLADPKITSSLAVTVYRSLPNATDFNVWQGELGLSGFNYATIGGAHHYHQPSDSPENISDRTIQHMGDHVFHMHRAIDRMDEAEFQSLATASADRNQSNAVFFDVFGFFVVRYDESTQRLLAGVTFFLCGWLVFRSRVAAVSKTLVRLFTRLIAATFVASLVGAAVQSVLWTTPWSGLRYTPVDYPAGVITVVASFIAATAVLKRMSRPAAELENQFACDGFHFLTSAIAVAAAVLLPGGAYLLVLPCFVYAVVRIIPW